LAREHDDVAAECVARELPVRLRERKVRAHLHEAQPPDEKSIDYELACHRVPHLQRSPDLGNVVVYRAAQRADVEDEIVAFYLDDEPLGRTAVRLIRRSAVRRQS
jgi:hypothetical protein